jgi:hypothetical protein
MYDSVDKNNHMGGPNKLVWRELKRFDPKEIIKKKGPIKVTKQSHFYIERQRLNLFSKPFQTHSKAARMACMWPVYAFLHGDYNLLNILARLTAPKNRPRLPPPKNDETNPNSR